MAQVEVKLPELGEEAGDTAEVSFWYLDPGEKVEADDNLVQMLTEKATFDVPCPEGGTLVEHKVAEGDEVKVGQVLCILDTGE